MKERVVCLFLVVFFLLSCFGCSSLGAVPAATRTGTWMLELPPLLVPAPTPSPPQVIVDVLYFYEEEDMALIAIRFGSITKAIKLEVGEEVIGEAWYWGQPMCFRLYLSEGGTIHFERLGQDISRELEVFQL